MFDWKQILGGIIIAIVSSLLTLLGMWINDKKKARASRKDKYAELKERLKKYENREAIRASLTAQNHAYYSRTEKEGVILYCSACFDNNDKLIKLSLQNNGYGYCPVCQRATELDDIHAHNVQQRRNTQERTYL